MKLGPARKVRAAGLEIQYRIARSAKRVRSIAVQVKPDGTVVARAPAGISTKRIDHLIAQKTAWIFAKQRPETTRWHREFRSGESIALFGRHLRFRIVENVRFRSVRIEQTGRWLRIEIPKLTPARRRLAIRRAITRWYRERAAEKLPTRILRFARQLGIAPPHALIRDQLRRWASCAPNGTLRFNWRLAMAPISLVDYVVVADGILIARQTRSEHGAVASAPVAFKDAIIEFKFRFEGAASINAVCDDKAYQGSHAGHICRVAITPKQVRLGDDKEGGMRNDILEMRRDPARKAEGDKLMEGRVTAINTKLVPHRWYRMTMEIVGDAMPSLDGQPIGYLKSPGIAHPTKSHFHFTVNGKDAQFDDVRIWAAVK